MKTRSILAGVTLLVFAWVFLFAATREASSSPLLRITFTPTVTRTPTVTQTPTKTVTPTARPTLPPPSTRTEQPLIPVTGSDDLGGLDLLVAGGLLLLVLGVVGLSWPAKRMAR